MQTYFIRIGKYFINLETILWVHIAQSDPHPRHRSLTLVSGGGAAGSLTFGGQEAEAFLTFLESHSHDLNPPEFKPLS